MLTKIEQMTCLLLYMDGCAAGKSKRCDKDESYSLQMLHKSSISLDIFIEI